MGLFRFFGKALSPKRRIAALVDAVVDRINDRYEFQGRIRLVDGGADFSLRLVDVRPQEPKIDLDQVAKADD